MWSAPGAYHPTNHKQWYYIGPQFCDTVEEFNQIPLWRCELINNEPLIVYPVILETNYMIF